MESSGRVSCLLRLVSLLAVVAGFSWTEAISKAQAQMFRVPGFSGPDESENESAGLHTERRVEEKLKQIAAAARMKKTADVLEHLEYLRAADPMLIVRGSDKVFVPLHRDLTTLIQGFSPEIREAIEKSDPGAEAALRRAIESDAPVALPTMLQQFAGTRAAGKAHLLLAAKHADRGHNLAARYWLAPLLSKQADPELKVIAEKINVRLVPATEPAQAGTQPPGNDNSSAIESRKSTEGTAEDRESAPKSIGDTSAASQSPQDSTADVAANGDPSVVTSAEGQQGSSTNVDSESAAEQNGNGSGESVIQHRHWFKSLPISSTARTRSQQLLQESPEIKGIPWSAWQPELDAENIYIRMPGLISAYRLSSGQHLWSRTLSHEQSPTRSLEPDLIGGALLRGDGNSLQEAMSSPEILQLHRNEMVGRMTSDAERLYLVSQLSSGNGPVVSRGMVRFRGAVDQMKAGLWELVALDKKTGRRLWTMGGPPVEEKFGNELATGWLAGPPAVDRGNLYQVVEKESVVHLVCLDAATGRLRWRVPLSYPQSRIGLDAARQLLAAQTSVRDGLVCTTSTTGWVFAVDTMTHSIIWARKLNTRSADGRDGRTFDNSGTLMVDIAPLKQAWRSQPPVLLGDKLLVPTSESATLLCIDPVSGRTRTTSIPASGVTVVLHHDPQWLILASAESIIGFSLPQLKKSWTLKLTDPATPPVGPASRQEDDLYVPLADGSAAVVSIGKGTFKQTLRRFRPAWSTGGFYSTQNGILSHAPDHLMLMSREPLTGHDETDPLQHARFLFESGSIKEASLAAAKITVTALHRDTVRRLRFRIAVAMLKAEDENSKGSPKDLIAKEAAQLEDIAGMAQTAQEKALTNFLRLDFLLRTAPENVVPALIDALALDESVHMVDVPVTASMKELLADASGSDPLVRNPLTTALDQRFLTFRAWVLMQLRDRIATADAKERNAIILALAAVPDTLIVEMHSKGLAEESLRRAEIQLQNGECNELTLQLLMSAADAQLDAPADEKQPEDNEQRIKVSVRIADGFAKARELLLKKSNVESAHRELVDRILAVAQYELQGKLPGMTIASPDDNREFIVNRVAGTPELPLTMLPVSNTGRMMGRMPGRSDVNLSSSSDAFLAAFRWSVRTIPGAIQAKSVREPFHAPWTISREASGNINDLRNHELYRFGTVLLLADSDGLSAFSVTEQRWLWRKTAAEGFSSRRTRLSEKTFGKLDTGFSSLAIWFGGSGVDVCGGNARWVCLKSNDSVEVIDVYTGNRLWGIPLEEAYSSVLAYRSTIIGHTGFAHFVMLNPVDGREQVSAVFSAGELSAMALLRETPESILTLRHPFEGPPTLLWINQMDGLVKRQLELSEKMHTTIMEEELLAVLQENGDLKVVDLMTGAQQDFAGSGAEIAKSLSIEPTKMAFHADALNYYVYEMDDNALGLFAFETARLIPVKTSVVAFSRSTGKLAWAHPLKATGGLYVDGPDEFIVVAEINENAAANPGGGRPLNIPGLMIQMGQTYNVKGLSRATGLSRFSYKVAAQRPFSEIRLTRTTANQLDLEAFGHRVRFISSPVATTP
jgi:outer membrane protein assembly factor BamB